jgi:hypothetical protein
MNTFGRFSTEKITGLAVQRDGAAMERLESFGTEVRGQEASGAQPAKLDALNEEGVKISSNDLGNQFLVFQWGDDPASPGILTSNQINPALKGGENPDVLAKVDLLSFQLGANDRKGEDTKLKAVMRVDFGQDENSSTHLDQITYSVLAGLDLYNEIAERPTKPKEHKADFNQAFAKRPIQIAGGLGKLRFEVCKVREPAWWQEIFKWLQSDAGKALTSALGFPGLASQAVGIVDKFINNLLGTDKPEVLFQSRAMTLALSQFAKTDFTGNVPSVQIGSLKPGVCLLARGKDLGTLIDSQPVYRGELGILVPKGISEEDVHSGAYENPFQDMTYGVFRVRLSETKISPF